MADLAASARPSWATICWTDDRFIYTEVPCKDGPPLIQKYALTEGGLTKALAFLRTFRKAHEPSGGDYKILKQANIKHAKPQVGDAEREKARDILRKMKII